MNIGYACLAIAVPGTSLKTCMLKNADADRLLSLIASNLDALARLIDYNARCGIKLFRISSDLIPFGSSAAFALPWQSVYAQKLSDIGRRIADAGMRVSMHPGQYTVLNSPDDCVVQRAVDDLRYHASVLDCLGLGREHKIILHLGGVYGDKAAAQRRFLSRYASLEPAIQSRLVLENDDKLFHIADVLETAAAGGIPVVYDTLHNAVNPADARRTDLDWIKRCAATWTTRDGAPKIHYSQQHPQKKPGAHSDSTGIDAFLAFYSQLTDIDADIMLEVKDKNLSALKCIHCVSNRGISALEGEWARYKYAVLEHSAAHYQAVRTLLQDKSAYRAEEMYRLIEDALALPVSPGSGENAARHVWGYFKENASAAERQRFETLLRKWTRGEAELRSVKSFLLRLAQAYHEDYLLNGYYFDL